MISGFPEVDGRRVAALHNGTMNLLPSLQLQRKYSPAHFLKDVFAGVVLTTVLVPIGMGYAEASGLPATSGLYATIAALIVYAVLGPSGILILGPDSALVAIIAATILPLAARGSFHAIELACILALVSGTFCLIASFIRLGFVTDLISKPIRYGYLNAIALTVIMGQLPKIFGFQANGFNVMQESSRLYAGIMENQTNWISLSIGLFSMLLIWVCKKYAPKIPGILIAVLLATFAVIYFELDQKLSLLGSLPAGIPALHFPLISYSEITPLIGSSLAIALLSCADMSVVSRTFCHRGKYKVDENRELFALGVANIASALFQGCSVTASATRTPVAEIAGGRTQITGLTAAFCILILLVGAPDFLRYTPSCVLAAIVISATFSLIEWKGIKRLFKSRPVELLSTTACFLGVVLFGVVQGIFLAIGLSLLLFIWRAWRPYSAVLGRVDNLKGYHDITRHPEAKRIPGLVLFRWDAPLFFANARIFCDQIMQAIELSPTTVHRVVVEAEPVTDVDATAADSLMELENDLSQRGIELCFAQVKGPVKDALKRYGLFQSIGAEKFFPTMGQAVDNYIKEHNIEWLDWEDSLEISLKTDQVSQSG